ncbi:MAG: efflux RND transporter periplasmic adaptor subunit [Ignavibacteriales bacterium]|nr:efflux RND transporter periplasmic adaptor subunit [Ignavibacteriales bacterium]
MRYFISLFIILTAFGLPFSGCGSKNEGRDSANNEAHRQAASDYYTCPMHPSVRSDKAGVCPVCHMTLVKVSEIETSAESGNQSGSVHLTTARQVLANVATFQTESRSLTRELILAGKIYNAEPNTQQITARFGGRIEKLSISYTGQQVRRGDPVADIYSPEAIAAQREFLVTLGTSTRETEVLDHSERRAPLLTENSRSKLQYWGFTDTQIDELARTSIVKTLVTVHSPVSGTVIRKNVDLQQYIAPGDPLFDVSDLRTVWLQMEVYESELAAVKLGQIVTATIDAYPSEEFRGTVSFIGAVVEPSTRTVRVRASLNNAGYKLKPEMFAQAVLHISLAKAIVVPASAVITTGRNSVVWVEGEANHFEARAVKLGHRAGDFYQVLDGLNEGEAVAVSGGFLIDSESQLQVAATGEHKK